MGEAGGPGGKMPANFKTVSGATSKALAVFMQNSQDGGITPRKVFDTAPRDTPAFAANSACVQLSRFSSAASQVVNASLIVPILTALFLTCNIDN